MGAREAEAGLGGARVLDGDEVQDVLSGAFYTPEPREIRSRKGQPKPAHYKVICISLYTKDLERLDLWDNSNSNVWFIPLSPWLKTEL